MGLGADTVRKLNPRLVYCSVWAYGHTGPMKLHPGYEPMMQAFAGLFSVNGPDSGPTARIGVQVLDLGTGVWTALGCIAALLRRQSTGLGGEVDTSLFETALGWLNVHLAAFSVTQTQPERHRSGNAKVVVFQSFETCDGEVVIAAANDRLFAKLAKEVGFPQWASDPRFASNALRVQHKAEILGPMAEVLRSDTTAHWLERLEAIGVPCAPIHDLQDVVEQPQTAAIGMLQRVPGTGLDVVGLPVSFEGVRPSIRRRAPALGEHNQEVGAPLARTQKGAS
jgi:crotonobetainyl-CoA:carnitine CoA-transferase CaiB-like acyl-CoA transferase